MSYQLSLGDCLDILPRLAANSIDSIVCDPPYGLSFMNKGWDHGVPGAPFWEAALRVAKPGAMLLAFGGTRTHHRLMCAIEDAGWEIRDCLMWLYGQGFPKGHSQLKPAWEPIIMARKPVIGTVADNALAWGTSGINVDACRIPGLAEKPGGKIRSIRHFNGSETPVADMDAPEPHPQGRWPANLILDEEAAALLDEQSGESSSNWRKNKGTQECGSFGGLAGLPSNRKNGTDGPRGHVDTGGASRFFYCAKASKRDRDEGLEGMERNIIRVTNTGHSGNPSSKNGERKFIPRANHHPTVKPTSLMRWLVRLVTPPGGIVLDHFCGSGSTGKAAMLEGFSFIGIDREVEYLEIARRRIEYAAVQVKLPLLEVQP